MDNNVIPVAGSSMRKKIEQLEAKVARLEAQQLEHSRVNLLLHQKYQELRDLVTRALQVISGAGKNPPPNPH